MNAKSINFHALGVLLLFVVAATLFQTTGAMESLKALDKGAVGLISFAAMMLLIVLGVPIGFAMLGDRKSVV